MLKKENLPSFPGFVIPSTDFDAVRDQRRSMLLYYDVNLSTAHTFAANTQITLPLVGNSFYVDQDSANVGNATVHFQDSVNSGSAPVYVSAGFIAKVPFTQLVIENAAQAGKRLRIFYGVDIDFQPSTSASVSINPPTSAFTNSTINVGVASTAIAAANAGRKYLMIQNNGATDIFIVFGAAATLALGVKIAAGGGFYELNSNVPSNAVNGISTVANPSVILVEG